MMTNTKTRHRNNPGREALRSEMVLSWDDPWGSALSNAFGLCEVLTAFGHAEKIPAELAYSSGAGGPDLMDYPTCEFVDMYIRDEFTVDDAVWWLRVLNAYLDLVPEKDRY